MEAKENSSYRELSGLTCGTYHQDKYQAAIPYPTKDHAWYHDVERRSNVGTL